MKWKIGTLLVVGVATITVGLSLFVTGYWSTEISERTGAVAAVSESEGDGLHEGIKVHGEYEIEVRDPDGTLVARRITPNEVTSNGKARIISAMAGNSGTFPTWMVIFMGSNKPCPTIPCGIRVGNQPYAENSQYQSTASLSASGNSLTLSGSYIAGNNPSGFPTSAIEGMQSFFGADPYQSDRFAVSSISPPVQVTKGQLINVTYTISLN